MAQATDSSKLDFLGTFSKLLDSPKHADLLITVDEHEFHAHTMILSLRSDSFANRIKLQDGFARSTIGGYSAHTVWRMLTYCYTGDYTDAAKDGLGKDDPGDLMHFYVYSLAKMLNIPSLKTLATYKLKAIFANARDFRNFPDTVRKIYSETDSQDLELRRILIDVARKHLKELMYVSGFRDTLCEFGEFSGKIVIVN